MSWKYSTLGDVCNVYNGSTPKRSNSEYWVNGTINWFTVEDIRSQGRKISYTTQKITQEGLKSSSLKILPKNSVLICCTASVGEYCLTKIELCTNQQFNGLVIKNEDTLHFNYLYYFVSTIKNQLENLGGQATINFVSMTKLKSILIPIPPLSEQKQIVETLDKAFEKIDKVIANIERNIENAGELLESKVFGIFNQSGNKWTQMTLGEIGKVSMCKRILKKETNSTGGIPFYKIGTFGKKANAYISKDIYQEYSNKYSFPKKGDILISASGTIGRRVVYDGDPAYFQDSNIVWIDNNESKILNKYLYHFYGVCEWNPSKGATISRLYNDDLRRIKISFPDKVTQLELVKQVESLKKLSETLLSDYIKKLDNIKELRKSILEKAFKGELISAA